MSLVTTDELNTHIYDDIVTAIDPDELGKLQTAIDTAEDMVKGSMGRYDIIAIFSATEESRSLTLMKLIKDLAVFEFIKLANPNLPMEFWKEVYDTAVMSLKDIARGTTIPYGWAKAATPTNTGQRWDYVGRNKRETGY